MSFCWHDICSAIGLVLDHRTRAFLMDFALVVECRWCGRVIYARGV